MNLSTLKYCKKKNRKPAGDVEVMHSDIVQRTELVAAVFVYASV